jgi:hypothetical protein
VTLFNLVPFRIDDDEQSFVATTCFCYEYDALAYPMEKPVDDHQKFFLRHHQVGGQLGSLQHHAIVGEHPSNDYGLLYQF